jgi:hypothetical protein
MKMNDQALVFASISGVLLLLLQLNVSKYDSDEDKKNDKPNSFWLYGTIILALFFGISAPILLISLLNKPENSNNKTS